MFRTKSLGKGVLMVYDREDGEFICKLEKSKRSTWNIMESRTGYLNYGYVTKAEAINSAISGKDCRKYGIGI